MGDMYGERAGQGSSNTRRLWKKLPPNSLNILSNLLAQSLPHVAGHCPAKIWHVELPEEGTVPRAVKPPYCSCYCSDCPQYVEDEIAYCIQWRPKPLH